MQNWKLSAISLLVIGCATYATASYSDGEVFESYLAAAGNDSTAAVAAMEADIILFSGEVLVLERDLKVERASVDRYEKLYNIERGNWIEQIWNSDFMRWASFVFGVWLGTQSSGW